MGRMGRVFLTLTSTAPNASDLGFLLHKHPERMQQFALPMGLAHVFYPEASAQRCTVALLVEVDPIALAQDRRTHSSGFVLGRYVNDRPYVASSLLAVALARVFATALRGQCVARPELVDEELPLSVHLPALPDGGVAGLIESLFEPLGWAVTRTEEPADPAVPYWGLSGLSDVRLAGQLRLADALSHLYVLLPVLDDGKHYWVGPDEVDKLIRRAGSWLSGHPQRDLISRRYLAHQRRYVAEALDRLGAIADGDEQAPPESIEPETGEPEPGKPQAGEPGSSRPQYNQQMPDQHELPRTPTLREVRRAQVVAALREVGAHRVVDLGCGDGSLLLDLLADSTFTRIIGADVSADQLAHAERRLGLDRLAAAQAQRVELIQSSATYRDPRLADTDAIVLMEVIEHVEPDRLPDLERVVFAAAGPPAVVVTTPNREYNARYPGLADGSWRHPDHRFEWTRSEFLAWAEAVAGRNGYRVQCRPVGTLDSDLGAPTQLALFEREAAR